MSLKRFLVSMLMIVGIAPASIAATIGTFTGGDVGEGLDLDGNIIYAVNIAGDGNTGTAPDYSVRGATFRDDFFNGLQLIPGVTINHTSHDDWGTRPNYGSTTNDDNLEEVIWDAGAGTNFPRVQFDNLLTNTKYKMQVLLSDNGYTSSRHGTYVVYGGSMTADPVGDGRTIFDTATNVYVTDTVGAANTATIGVVVTLSFNTGAFTTVSLTTRNGDGIGDGGAFVNAVTVEQLPAPTALSGGLVLLAAVVTHRRLRASRG